VVQIPLRRNLRHLADPDAGHLVVGRQDNSPIEHAVVELAPAAALRMPRLLRGNWGRYVWSAARILKSIWNIGGARSVRNY
jgi:hypothetical protein